MIDCFSDSFADMKELSCMLCNEKLKVDNLDHLIKHCWEHKIQSMNISSIVDDDGLCVGNSELYAADGEHNPPLQIEICTDADFNSYQNSMEVDDQYFTDVNEKEVCISPVENRVNPKFKPHKRKTFETHELCPYCNKVFKYRKALVSHLK